MKSILTKPLPKATAKTYLMEVNIIRHTSVLKKGNARVYLENGEHYLEMGETSVKMPIQFINHAIDDGKIEIKKIILKRELESIKNYLKRMMSFAKIL